jgi:hypothetical protein
MADMEAGDWVPDYLQTSGRPDKKMSVSARCSHD